MGALLPILIQIAVTQGPTLVSELLSLLKSNPDVLADITVEQIEALKNLKDPSGYFAK